MRPSLHVGIPQHVSMMGGRGLAESPRVISHRAGRSGLDVKVPGGSVPLNPCDLLPPANQASPATTGDSHCTHEDDSGDIHVQIDDEFHDAGEIPDIGNYEAP